MADRDAQSMDAHWSCAADALLARLHASAEGLEAAADAAASIS